VNEDAPPHKPLSVGEIVAGRYRVDALLGEGGMGIVYRAEHLHLRKPLALKVLLPEWSSVPEVVARFEREAVAAGNIQSPHVAAASDFGRLPDGSCFLVMEYVSGRTLRSILDGGALEPGRALHVLRGIVSALHAAHSIGIVHRDLKPENVMLVERDGDPDFVKVLDFGIAKVSATGAAQDGKALTRVGAVIGTPDYMSPEQAVGESVDARSDVYSAGVILYEMLAGRRPFAGGSVTVLRQHVLSAVPELPLPLASAVDPRVVAVLGRMLAKAPENRFATAAELLAEIDACIVANRPPVSPGAWPPASATPAGQASGGRRLRLIAAAAAIAVLATLLLVALGGRDKPGAAQPPVVPSVASAEPPVAVTPPSATAEPAHPSSAGLDPAAALPPPPTPSSTTAGESQHSGSSPSRPQPSQTRSRRTGPGGIYIPPPSQWFK
jgi:serine/threonine-protein kinase